MLNILYSIPVKHFECTIMGDRNELDQFGFVGFVPFSGPQVLHYVEKPSTFVSDIINCGIYLFTPEIFQHIGAVFQKNQQDLML